MFTFNFLTLDELDKLKSEPCTILLYCRQKYDKRERDAICDRFVASQCRCLTSVGTDSGLWEVALDEADMRNNPDKDECWALTIAKEKLTKETIGIWSSCSVDSPNEIKVAYVIGDTDKSLRKLICKIRKRTVISCLSC